MLKYVDTKVTFSEVPDEIVLCINISNCPIGCINCHSSYLKEDIGTPLTWGNLNSLIYINRGITCVSFMGGDRYPEEINKLAYKVKTTGLKTCWYSGNQKLAKSIDLENFDYIKLGPYLEERGSLNKRTTNQKFYKVVDSKLINITEKFWK